MNIFLLDQNIKKSAQYYVDRHNIKIILEISQLLCNAHHINGTYLEKIPYKITHKNHPLSKWVSQSIENYQWCCKMGMELCKEYTYRFRKIHKCENIIFLLQKNNPKIINKNMTPFILAMPSKYKSDDPIKSYRDYYNGEKRHLFKWTKRNIPEWINER